MKRFCTVVTLMFTIAAVWGFGSGRATAGASTDVEIVGRNFFLNGVVANPTSEAAGVLLNARMVHAAIHDYNPATVGLWAYPNGAWDPNRNVNEFIAQLPNYSARGLNMVTVSMQGGHPRYRCASESGVGNRNFSMFESDGDLRPDAAARMETVIRGANSAGIVVNVQYFHQHMDHLLSGNAAVIEATKDATTFLRDLNVDNVLIEVANEVSLNTYDHTALEPGGIDDRIDQVHGIWPDALVSVSMMSAYPSAVAQRVDWSSFHANQADATTMRNKAQKFIRLGKPVLVTEDEWDQSSFDTALDIGIGWGFYEQGCEYTGSYRPGSAARYRDGFQSLPVNWSINTSGKIAFFNAVSQAT